MTYVSSTINTRSTEKKSPKEVQNMDNDLEDYASEIILFFLFLALTILISYTDNFHSAKILDVTIYFKILPMFKSKIFTKKQN